MDKKRESEIEKERGRDTEKEIDTYIHRKREKIKR